VEYGTDAEGFFGQLTAFHALHAVTHSGGISCPCFCPNQLLTVCAIFCIPPENIVRTIRAEISRTIAVMTIRKGVEMALIFRISRKS